MKKADIIIMSLFSLAVTVNVQKKATVPNVLSSQQKKEGWELLFDGKSTKGWHTFNKSKLGSSWKAKDGALYLDSSKKGG